MRLFGSKTLLAGLTLAACVVAAPLTASAGGYGYNNHNYNVVCKYVKIKFYDGYGYPHYKTRKVCRKVYY